MRGAAEVLAVEEEVVVQGQSEASGSGVYTLFLEGELGQAELSQVAGELERLFRRGVTEVVLDLADVGHLDYRGVRPLVKRVEALRRMGAEVKLSGVSSYLLAILRVSGAHSVFQVYAGHADARRAFEEASGEK